MEGKKVGRLVEPWCYAKVDTEKVRNQNDVFPKKLEIVKCGLNATFVRIYRYIC